MKFLCASVLASCLMVGTASAQNPMRAGRWEVTTQMQMPNMPMQMPETKTVQCVTPEQLKDPVNALPSASARADKCKVSDYKVTGSTASWKFACPAPQDVSGSGEIVFSGDTYAGAMKMTMQQGDMTMKLTGKRLGDCAP